MKRIILAVILLMSVSFAQAQKIKGSDTMLPLSQQEAENYMKINPSQAVIVTGGGSGVGISSLIEETTDIAQSSRKMKFDEKQKFQAAGKAVTEVVAAYDALAVIVHPSNKVQNLTREQLEGIFTGKIRNWKEVGGEDLRIIPYARETSSGTYEFFKDNVLKHKNYVNGIMSMPATGAIIQSISQTKGAIGYVGLAYMNKTIKAIHVSYDKGNTYVEPSLTTAKNGTYPVVRPLLYYYLSQSENKVKSFMNYVLSDAGQKIVSEVGFITVK
ncbi:MAG: PstS family phosphate ABC transporter substrate-binding protein [Prevotellaceae bacterium]|jgi:phosphate transport system substrate-binding protein|nr:PstS family phosphate ABC transporter substrate-binding protein [Prevotellaceae bacterium]